MSEPPQRLVADRLREAGLSTARFIDVQNGSKASVDHTQLEADAISGNYGIYANGSDQLVILDIDDYGDLEDNRGLSALDHLPKTFEQGSPHNGTHRLYKIEPTEDGHLVAAVLEDAFGSPNLAPSWGEVRVQNQYVVGAGSQLDGCDKDWCEACANPEEGNYVVRNDKPIVTLSADELIDALEADPGLLKANECDQNQPQIEASSSSSKSPSPPEDIEDRLENARERDDKLDRLMRGDYSNYDGDRSTAEYVLAGRLAFWLGDDKTIITRVLDHYARTQKWAERDDNSYRESILSAVDQQDDFYDPGHYATDDSYPPDLDEDEIDRADAILAAERGVTDPHGQLKHKNGRYGYHFETKDENGNPHTQFVAVTNFTLELEHVIETYEGKLLTIRVYPASPMEDDYTVQVHPKVFNSPSTFNEEIVRGRTTYFNPQKNPTDTLIDLQLTVAHQNAPEHRGTEYIGLHGSGYTEWVTPVGTLSANGWVTNPGYKYYEKGGNQDMESSLEDKWQLTPSDGSDYDANTVRKILQRVPKTRLSDRGLPILGWFYAAPLKPVIHDIEGEFNLLQVTGDTESGKTSTLQLFYQLFGADPAPFGCGDTNFTIEKKFAGSCGLPIWLDEYKPSDLSEHKINWLHRRLREVTREKSVSKGQHDLGEITFNMRAPVVFSGEQTVTEAAVRRRCILTQLSGKAREGEHREAFSQLVGSSYTTAGGEERYPPGLNLHDHAYAFYQHILSKDVDEIRNEWRNARQQTQDHLRALNVPDLDGSEMQGLQTVVFGINIFREFATEFDVDDAHLPSDAEVQRALDHIVYNIGPGGRRREHIDEFVELLARAASHDYLEEDVHHRVYEPDIAEGRALAFHMPTAFDSVKKYVRDHGIEDEHSLLGKNDYIDSFRDKAKKSDSYPLAVNHRVRNIENGTKCVVIDPERAEKILPDGFNLSAFSAEVATEQEAVESKDSDDDDGDGSSTLVTSLADLSPGYTTVEATLASLVKPKPWLQAEGTLDDGSTVVDVIARGDENLLADVEQGQTVRLSKVKVCRNQDEVLQVELRDGTTDVTLVSRDTGQQSGLDSHAASDESETVADGGTKNDGAEPPDDAVGPKADGERLATIISSKGAVRKDRAISLAVEHYDMEPNRAESVFDLAIERGLLTRDSSAEVDKYRATI